LSSASEFIPYPMSYSFRKDRLSVDSGSSQRVSIEIPVQMLSLQEEVDQIIDDSIEMDSIKQIRDQHVHPLTLRFLLPDMESTVMLIFILIIITILIVIISCRF
jgi:hypothetical protein